MPENALKVGDEVKCPHCGKWHSTFTKEQQTIDRQDMLFVRCVRGEYFVGRVGGLSRWQRREPETGAS